MSEKQAEQEKIKQAEVLAAEEAKEDEDIDDLDNILDEDQHPLSVTADERSQTHDDDMDPQTKEEYEKFMEEMKKGGGAAEMDFISGMVGKMFAGMNLGGDGSMPNPAGGNPTGAGGAMPDFSAFQNQFGDIFKNFEDNPEYDALAGKLLEEFMDKDILEEPLLDSKKKYEEYLAANESKLSQEDLTRYKNQQRCVNEILDVVKNEPANKDKMIAKFEEMQEFGQPPEPLINAFGGDSPFAAFTQPPGAPGQQQMPGGKQQMPGMGPPGGEECRIF